MVSLKQYKVKTESGVELVMADHALYLADGSLQLMKELKAVATFAPGKWEWVRVSDNG